MIVISLATGLYYIVKPSQNKERVAKALTTRISISILLLLLITFGAFMGWFQPMSLLSQPKVPLESNKQKQIAPTRQSQQSANTKQPPQSQNGE